jgi:hypothetical protein
MLEIAQQALVAIRGLKVGQDAKMNVEKDSYDFVYRRPGGFSVTPCWRKDSSSLCYVAGFTEKFNMDGELVN